MAAQRCQPWQLETLKRQAVAAEAALRASMEKELQETREAAHRAKVEAEKELKDIRQASAGGTRELTERAKRREEVCEW